MRGDPPLHVGDVALHHGARPIAVARLDRFEQRGVRALHLRPVRLGKKTVRRDHVRLEVDERVDRHGVDGIAGGGGQPAVEVEIEVARIAAAGDDREALVERGPQLLDVPIGGALRGQARDLGLENQARFGELSRRQAAEAQERREVARDDARVDRPDEVAAGRALPHLEEPAMLERAERFTHRHAAGAEAAAELALGRKLVAALEAAVVDRALDVSDDVVVHARRADGRKHGATVRRKEPEVKHGKRANGVS